MDITPDVLTDFRTYFPEFSDTNTWPDSRVKRHLQDGAAETGSSRWGSYGNDPFTIKARGVFNFGAHALVLEEARKKAVAAGQAPVAGGRVQSRTVGDESINYAVPVAQSLTEDARFGSLTATLYGQEFLRLRRRAGMGAASTGSVAL